MKKIFPVTKSSMPSIEEYVKLIEPLWETRFLTNMGSLHQRLKEELCNYLKVPAIALFTNGHLALESAISALELSGEVITTPFTFISTTQAIVRNGLTPVFCDISPVDFTINPSKIEELITPRTSAIIPVHVYGNICAVDEINQIAKKYGLKLIYDAAHAFGIELNGVGIGNFGDISMFSFHATKVYHTIEGGGLVCRNHEIINKLAALKNFGLYSPEDAGEVGGNAKMSEFQAAMGLCNLRIIENEIFRRSKIVEIYRKRLEDTEGLYVCPNRKDVKPNNAYFPIMIEPEIFGETRDELFDRLRKKDIYTRKYFFPLTSQLRCFDGLFPIQRTPIAEDVSKKILTLPLFADMEIEDAEFICDVILEERK